MGGLHGITGGTRFGDEVPAKRRPRVRSLYLHQFGVSGKPDLSVCHHRKAVRPETGGSMLVMLYSVVVGQVGTSTGPVAMTVTVAVLNGAPS